MLPPVVFFSVALAFPVPLLVAMNVTAGVAVTLPLPIAYATPHNSKTAAATDFTAAR